MPKSYRQERAEFIARMRSEGMAMPDVLTLLRAATTIERVAVLDCNGWGDTSRAHRYFCNGSDACNSGDGAEPCEQHARSKRAEIRAAAACERSPARWRVVRRQWCGETNGPETNPATGASNWGRPELRWIAPVDMDDHDAGNAARAFVLKDQGQSVSHATKHGGYTIERAGFSCDPSGDPRGYTLKIHTPGMSWNTWGGQETGHGVPSRPVYASAAW